MNILYYDSLLYLFQFVNFNALFSLLRVSKHYNNIINNNDYLWKILANKQWHQDFFSIAKRRTLIISNPLNSYKKEIIRIIKYTNLKWTIEDSYHHWYLCELSYTNNKKKGKFPI